KNIGQQKLEKELNDLKYETIAFLKNYTNIDTNYKTPIEALQALSELIHDMQEFEKKLQEK
ncbi:MAG: hypothetical protein ACFFAJ_12475, partial [Candidatus Hodarchaeota archaeon]